MDGLAINHAPSPFFRKKKDYQHLQPVGKDEIYTHCTAISLIRPLLAQFQND